MISKWQWLLAQLTRTLWIRATLYVVLALAAALLAVLIERLLPGPLPVDIGADAVDRILDILASSMLVSMRHRQCAQMQDVFLSGHRPLCRR